MGIVIFDLDGTVICSKHRAVSKPDGSFCLDGWRANCTPKLIAADSLLPLAQSMRTLYAAGHTIVVCTARVCQFADLDFLANNHLQYHHFLSRDCDDDRSDGPYKVAKLTGLAHDLGYSDIAAMNAVMFDDNLGVIEALSGVGVTMFDATAENERLAA